MSQSKHEQAVADYDDGYYDKKLDEGEEFQDFVTWEFYRKGIPIVGYSSKKYQQQRGENANGIEIKRDGKFRDTGNLYIETAEKTHPNNSHYIDSGIYRRDNSWLFAIGDEKTIYVFAKKLLCRAIEETPEFRRVEKPTSRGVLLSIVDADTLCAWRIDPR